MNEADEIMALARLVRQPPVLAEKLTENVEHELEHEATVYTFEDESILVISGAQINTY